MVALCLLLMLGCGIGAVALVQGADDRLTVVAAARDIPAGTVITAQDLRAAELAGSGLSAIPGDRAGSLLGMTVTSSLPAGTLINAGMLTTNPVPGPGQVAVGLSLKDGQLPVELTAGRLVTVLRLPAAGQAGGTVPGAALVSNSRVLSVTPSASGGALVTLEVPAEVALPVSAAGAEGLAVLLLLPVGSS